MWGVDAFFVLTQAEGDLVRRVFAPRGRMILLRTGIPQHPATGDLFCKRYGLIKPYMLYAGRIERGKGLETVFDAYRELRRLRLLDLVLIGRQLMDLPKEEGVRYLGYLSETEKRSAFAGALFSIQPSPLESLSITTLESFVQKTPILANGHCAVLREHTEIGKGGLIYRDAAEFVHNALYLVDHLRERRRMGREGFAYVQTHFEWTKVMSLFAGELERLFSGQS